MIEIEQPAIETEQSVIQEPQNITQGTNISHELSRETKNFNALSSFDQFYNKLYPNRK